MKVKKYYLVALIGLILFYSCKKNENNNPASLPKQTFILSKNGSEFILTGGNTIYKTGYKQVTPSNKDAYVQKLVDGNEVWFKYYDTSPDDSRGMAINCTGSKLYVAFTCTGGNTSFKASAGAFQTSYGTGGGPKAIFFSSINPDNGDIFSATFINGQLDNGKANTMYPDDSIDQPITILTNNQVKLQAIHAYDKGDGHLTAGIADNDCKNSGGKWTGVFNENMALVSGDCF